MTPSKSDLVNINMPGGCVTLIGMPGSGKTTVGAQLAKCLGWAFMDTDYLLESLYATKLQNVVNRLSREAFLDAEAEMIKAIRAEKCVIATGGSVIYRAEAMANLADLGPIAHVKTSLSCLEERIALNPQRGIAFAPGQSLGDLYAERQPLYEKYSDFECDSSQMTPLECAAYIRTKLASAPRNRHRPARHD